MKGNKVFFESTLGFTKKYVLINIETVPNRLFKMKKSGGETVCIVNLSVYSKVCFCKKIYTRLLTLIQLMIFLTEEFI